MTKDRGRPSDSRLLLLTAPFCALALGLVACSTPASGIPEDQFDALHALIKPQAEEEQWRHMPWMTSLWEARRRAAEEGKPILLWEMDGHPLGST